jgi:hypothetical protein
MPAEGPASELGPSHLPRQFLIAMVAHAINAHVGRGLDYLLEEIRVLREALGPLPALGFSHTLFGFAQSIALALGGEDVAVVNDAIDEDREGRGRRGGAWSHGSRPRHAKRAHHVAFATASGSRLSTRKALRRSRMALRPGAYATAGSVPREHIECQTLLSRVTITWSTIGIPRMRPTVMSFAVVARSSWLGLHRDDLGDFDAFADGSEQRKEVVERERERDEVDKRDATQEERRRKEDERHD